MRKNGRNPRGHGYNREMATIQRLLDIMARLRDPVDGCPWDLDQDFASISPFTIEEAYEVDEAILSGDLDALRDELGDLLFQVVFQARIAEELGAFDFEGITEAIASKLVRRHPHIFADASTPKTLQDQTATWESIKARERSDAAAARNVDGDRTSTPDPFAGIPRNLPALARSAKLAGRIEQMRIEGAEPGITESEERSASPWAAAFGEVQRASNETEAALLDSQTRLDRESSLAAVGQGLRSWVLLARSLGVDPEQALRQADELEIAAVREFSTS
jgi:nucleoside triphosphate diphosphatase